MKVRCGRSGFGFDGCGEFYRRRCCTPRKGEILPREVQGEIYMVWKKRGEAAAWCARLPHPPNEIKGRRERGDRLRPSALGGFFGRL